MFIGNMDTSTAAVDVEAVELGVEDEGGSEAAAARGSRDRSRRLAAHTLLPTAKMAPTQTWAVASIVHSLAIPQPRRV
jgi:hypothetical protein